MSYMRVTITEPGSSTSWCFSYGCGQLSKGARSSSSVTGNLNFMVNGMLININEPAQSNAVVSDVWLAMNPHSNPPAALHPKNTNVYTATARARTQLGTEVWVVTCRLERTVIQAVPLSSITGSRRRKSRTNASAKTTAASYLWGLAKQADDVSFEWELSQAAVASFVKALRA